MTQAYAPYEASSHFYLIADRAEQCVAGVLRVIKSSPAGLKTLNDIEQAPLRIPRDLVMAHYEIDSLENCWDIATLAVPKEYRLPSMEQHVSALLYRALYADICRRQVEHAVSVMDRRAYRHLTHLLGFPFRPILGAPAFGYLGSASSYAVHVFVPEAKAALEHRRLQLQRSGLRSVDDYLNLMLFGIGMPYVIEVE
jgi:hypothetical protein